jgi:hypothetical protein
MRNYHESQPNMAVKYGADSLLFAIGEFADSLRARAVFVKKCDIHP